MKKILTTTLFLVVALSAKSQDITYSKDYSGRTIAKDQYGNIVAIGTTDYKGNFVWKDQYGNIINTESTNYKGEKVSKDRYGNVNSTQTEDYK
jgi:hypothetical protein